MGVALNGFLECLRGRQRGSSPMESGMGCCLLKATALRRKREMFMHLILGIKERKDLEMQACAEVIAF